MYVDKVVSYIMGCIISLIEKDVSQIKIVFSSPVPLYAYTVLARSNLSKWRSHMQEKKRHSINVANHSSSPVVSSSLPTCIWQRRYQLLSSLAHANGIYYSLQHNKRKKLIILRSRIHHNVTAFTTTCSGL